MNDVIRQRKESVFFKTRNFSQKLLTISIAMIVASQAHAQIGEPSRAGKTMEEVTVTAQRRTERALDVPISITALSADQLGQGDVQQLSDIMKLTPALRFDNTGGFFQPTIRGVGTAVVVAGGGSNVAIYTDGFYSPNPLSADTELLNIESVQVLKGPQGTLFGRNATGGAILVTTSDPSSEPHAEVEASYGNYNAQRYQAYVTGGPSDALAFDLAAQVRRGDGYLENIVTGSDEDGQYDNTSVRLGTRFDPTDRVSMVLRLAHNDTEDDSVVADGVFEEDGRVYSMAALLGAPVGSDPHEVSNGFKPRFNAETETAQLTVKVDLGSALLTSYTQYREESATHYHDFDASALPIFHFIFDTKDNIFTQELLLSSTGDSRLQWTTGLFYFDNRTVYENNRSSLGGSGFVPSGGSSVQASSIAVFGDVTYELRDDLFLTVGARYSQDEIEDAYFLARGTLARVDVPNIDDSAITPRVALRYEPNENSSIYISYAEGFKSGILNVGGGTLDNIEVEPEEIKAYETGYKYQGGSFMFDLSAFYYDYKELQVASYVADTSVIRNAADSTVQGIDGQLRMAVTEQLEVSLGAAYVKAEYDDFDSSQIWTQCANFSACGTSYGVFIPSFVDASGNEMQRSPQFTATLGVNYRKELGAAGTLNLSGTLYHTSEFYFDSSETYEQEAYELLSLRAAWTDPSSHFTVALFGDNLTDEEYRNQVLPQFYGALSTWGAPRTFGVSLGLSY